MTTVIIDGATVALSDRDVVGAGGEALVYGLPDGRVAKLFHTPTNLHREKVAALLSATGRLPAEVVLPEAEVLDAHRSFVGYVMPRLPSQFVPACELFRRPSFVTFDLSKRFSVWAVLRATVDALHRASVVVGDLSDQNVFVDPSSCAVRLIDSDSFQVGELPCPVQTDAYVDSLALHADRLTPAHDLYALHVLAVRWLLGVHPYGGTHPTHTTIAARARHGLFVVDPEVQYPVKVAQSPRLIGDHLLDALAGFFRKPDRPPVTDALLEATRLRLRSCAACGLTAVPQSGACPGCAATTPREAAGEKDDDGFDVAFAFTWIDAIGSTIAALEQTPEGRVLHASVGGRWRRITTAEDKASAVLLDGSRVAIASGSTVELWDLSTGSVVARTTTERGWGGPIMTRQGTSLVRSAGGRLVVGDLVLGRSVERLLGDISPQQTRLFASAPASPRLVAVSRIGRQLMIERVEQRGRYRLPLPDLSAGEALVDVEVLDDGAATLCLRQVRIAGATFVRSDLFGARGNLAATSCVPEHAHPTRNGISGRAFSGCVVLHPTSLGLIREVIVHGGVGDATLIDGTADQVGEASLLAATPRGLAVADGHRLFQLHPKR